MLGRASLTARTQQKLQRRIANFRGVAPGAALVSLQQSTEDVHRPEAESAQPPTVTVPTKRKYRRHPKVSSVCSAESRALPV